MRSVDRTPLVKRCTRRDATFHVTEPASTRGMDDRVGCRSTSQEISQPTFQRAHANPGQIHTSETGNLRWNNVGRSEQSVTSLSSSRVASNTRPEPITSRTIHHESRRVATITGPGPSKRRFPSAAIRSRALPSPTPILLVYGWESFRGDGRVRSPSHLTKHTEKLKQAFRRFSPSHARQNARAGTKNDA